MRLFLSLIAFLLITISAQSQVTGLWKTIDDNDGKVKSHMLIYEEDGKIFGKVEKLIEPEITICKKCKDERKNQPLLGMEIIWDMEYEGDNEWFGGHIIDPASGKIYKCKLELQDENTLDVRGYIGYVTFGRTQTWYRL